MYVKHLVSEAPVARQNRVLTYHQEDGGGKCVVEDAGLSEVRENLQTRGKCVVVNEVMHDEHDNLDDAVGDDCYNSDDFIKYVHFNDNEEGRDFGLHDGFSELDRGGFEDVAVEGTNVKGDVDGGRSDGVAESFMPSNIATMHDMKEEYVSEELESGVESDNDDYDKPRYEKFRP
ncbi:hypothetical protein SESBI_22889 [Sesbania bispinosa]|nr:hypothetical protein SESBI_22889 [Sesbania bispinosa]